MFRFGKLLLELLDLLVRIFRERVGELVLLVLIIQFSLRSSALRACLEQMGTGSLGGYRHGDE